MSAETKRDSPFEGEHARTYDQKSEKLAPIKESLLLLTHFACAGAPEDARILCVGVGTGEEVAFLARRNPGWRFTLVEPSHDMLEICRQKTEQQGLEQRCVFHEGYLDSLPDVAKFDAATCLLVAHFILDRKERALLYQQIADRLKPGGVLINADLSTDKRSPSYGHVLTLWQQMWLSAGYVPDENNTDEDNPAESNTDEDNPAESNTDENNTAESNTGENNMMDRMREELERQVALLPPAEVGDLLAQAGFRESTSPVFQYLLIHAWVSFKS